MNEWVLPRGVTEGQRELRVRFVVERPARPIDVLGGSGDDRVLGVGVKSVRVEGWGLG